MKITKDFTSDPRALNNKINPSFVRGFIDAEGCFFVGIQKSHKVKTN
jgi:hypothetical protein